MGSSVAQSHQLVHAVFNLVYAIVEVNKIILPLLLYLGQNSLIDDDDDDDDNNNNNNNKSHSMVPTIFSRSGT